MKKTLYPLCLMTCCLFPKAMASDITLKDFKFEGFLDSYYAYDLNRPADLERQYTTQPARHNEFNINLAHLGTTLEQENVRGRLALQYGTSVIKNYAGDPVLGSTSGPDKSRMIQEAYAGFKLNEKMWLDAGIYLGNIGMESWISKNNFTYTRSLMLDFVPYYSTGVRLSTEHSSKTKSQLHLMNGWQNISENNQDKALGMQISHDFSEKLTFVYNNFLGNEKRTALDPSRLRTYHDFITYWNFSEKWKFNYSFDVGTHERSNTDGIDLWFVTAGVLRYQLEVDKGLAFRMEYFNDKDQANVITGSPKGFRVVSYSMNYDQQLQKNILWRTEGRVFHSQDSIYPKHSGTAKDDALLVTSLALSF